MLPPPTPICTSTFPYLLLLLRTPNPPSFPFILHRPKLSSLQLLLRTTPNFPPLCFFESLPTLLPCSSAPDPLHPSPLNNPRFSSRAPPPPTLFLILLRTALESPPSCFPNPPLSSAPPYLCSPLSFPAPLHSQPSSLSFSFALPLTLFPPYAPPNRPQLSSIMLLCLQPSSLPASPNRPQLSSLLLICPQPSSPAPPNHPQVFSLLLPPTLLPPPTPLHICPPLTSSFTSAPSTLLLPPAPLPAFYILLLLRTLNPSPSLFSFAPPPTLLPPAPTPPSQLSSLLLLLNTSVAPSLLLLLCPNYFPFL